MQELIQYTLSDVGPFQKIYPCFILHYHNRVQESKNVIFTLFYEHSDLRLLSVVVIWIFDGKRQEQPHVSCLSQFADYIKAPGIQEHRPRGTPEIQGFIECFISCVQSSMTMGACRDVLVSPQSFKNRDVAMTYEQDHGLILNS